jgi:hypothetical protein
VPMSAGSGNPAPDSAPTAPLHQSVAAVFSPQIFSPSRRMTQAPRKPRPLTTVAAIRVGSSVAPISRGSDTNGAAPTQTRALVRSPAWCRRNCRGRPTHVPLTEAQGPNFKPAGPTARARSRAPVASGVYSAPTWPPFSATDRFMNSTRNASTTPRTAATQKTSK